MAVAQGSRGADVQQCGCRVPGRKMHIRDTGVQQMCAAVAASSVRGTCDGYDCDLQLVRHALGRGAGGHGSGNGSSYATTCSEQPIGCKLMNTFIPNGNERIVHSHPGQIMVMVRCPSTGRSRFDHAACMLHACRVPRCGGSISERDDDGGGVAAELE